MSKTPRTTKSEAIRTLAAYGHAACDRVEQLERELAEARAETVELKKGAESDTGTILRQANSIRVMGEELSDARAEVERLKEYTTCTLVTIDSDMDDKDMAIIKRDKLIEQMLEALEELVELKERRHSLPVEIYQESREKAWNKCRAAIAAAKGEV